MSIGKFFQNYSKKAFPFGACGLRATVRPLAASAPLHASLPRSATSSQKTEGQCSSLRQAAEFPRCDPFLRVEHDPLIVPRSAHHRRDVGISPYAQVSKSFCRTEGTL